MALPLLRFFALAALAFGAIRIEVDDFTHWQYHLSASLVPRVSQDRINLRLCRDDLIKVA